jgi:hypothetical protein
MRSSQLLLTLSVALLFVLSMASISGVSAYSSNDFQSYHPNISLATPTKNIDGVTGYSNEICSCDPQDLLFTYGSVIVIVPSFTCDKQLLKEYEFQETFWGVFSDGFDANDYAGAWVAGICYLSNGQVNSTYIAGAQVYGHVVDSPWSPAAGDELELSFKYTFSPIPDNNGTYHFTMLDVTQSRYFFPALSPESAPAMDAVECFTQMNHNATTTYPDVKFATVSFKKCLGSPADMKPYEGIGTTSYGGNNLEWTNYNSGGTTILSYATNLVNYQSFKVHWANSDGP